MRCNCKHENVCRYRDGFVKLTSAIAPPVFNPPHKMYLEIERNVRTNCVHREPRELPADMAIVLKNLVKNNKDIPIDIAVALNADFYDLVNAPIYGNDPE